MLILSRKVGESIVIAGEIEVMVTSIQNGRVKLGIKAPLDIDVDRKEIHEMKQKAMAESN